MLQTSTLLTSKNIGLTNQKEVALLQEMVCPTVIQEVLSHQFSKKLIWKPISKTKLTLKIFTIFRIYSFYKIVIIHSPICGFLTITPILKTPNNSKDWLLVGLQNAAMTQLMVKSKSLLTVSQEQYIS